MIGDLSKTSIENFLKLVKEENENIIKEKSNFYNFDFKKNSCLSKRLTKERIRKVRFVWEPIKGSRHSKALKKVKRIKSETVISNKENIPPSNFENNIDKCDYCLNSSNNY